MLDNSLVLILWESLLNTSRGIFIFNHSITLTLPVMSNCLLAIDTTSARCSTAILLNGKLHTRSSDRERQAAQLILPMIEDLMSSVDSSLADLEGIAVAAGPGSFTGIRIGIGVAQGLGLSLSIPVLALSNLAIMAMAAIAESTCDNVMVSMKARDSEVYFASYRGSERDGVMLLGQEQVCRPANIQRLPAAEIEPQHWYATGDGWDQRDEILRTLRRDTEHVQFGQTQPAVELHLGELCKLAKLRFALGEGVAAEQVIPNYIKEQSDYS